MKEKHTDTEQGRIGEQKQQEMYDTAFYDCADIFIEEANKQLSEKKKDMVAEAMLYAAARFESYARSCKHKSGEVLRQEREQIVEEMISEYKLFLEENLDDYIEHFDSYMSLEGVSDTIEESQN